MNIYLIRHTTPAIELIYCYGQSDLDVAETFEQEAQRTKSLLPDFNNVKIYASPLIRCKKLAEFLDIGNIIFDERLKEFHFGEWEMVPWKELNINAFDEWKKDFVNRETPGGESFQQMHDRVMEFFDNTLQKEIMDVVLVCHGGVIRAILANILRMPLKYMFRMNIDFGSVSRIVSNNGEVKVDYINR
jgi:alpha-ribazole phosphatase